MQESYDTFLVIQSLVTERITTENAHVIYFFARTVRENRQNLSKSSVIRQILQQPLWRNHMYVPPGNK